MTFFSCQVSYSERLMYRTLSFNGLRLM